MADKNSTGQSAGADAAATASGAAGGGASQGSQGASAGQGGGTGGGAMPSAGEMSERMRAGGESMAQSGAQLGLKMLDQAETNTREAFRAMREAAQAKDVSEVMKVQGDFLREASNRSVAQAREIGELIASFGREAMGQFGGRK